MPRKADVPCTVCGRLLPTYPDSAPPDRRRCGACIKAAAEPWEHGTRAGYRREGCRCDECRAWNTKAQTDYAREYRERTGTSLRRKYGREVRYEPPVPRPVRLAIYERDGWICQLCFEPVDPDLHFNHRMAATLDHIECQSWALVPDHRPENLRLAHRSCNSIRRDRESAGAA